MHRVTESERAWENWSEERDNKGTEFEKTEDADNAPKLQGVTGIDRELEEFIQGKWGKGQ